MTEEKKSLHVKYFALLREKRGKNEERLTTTVPTALDLYKELDKKYGFGLPANILKIAINDEIVDWSNKLRSDDNVVFIPPVAGG